jgi:hypothetical protein
MFIHSDSGTGFFDRTFPPGGLDDSEVVRTGTDRAPNLLENS